MSAYTQTERPVQIVTPLGEDVLLLQGFRGHESVSQPFRFKLSLLSRQRQLDMDAAVGMRATIKLLKDEGDVQRYINGCVVSFSQGGTAYDQLDEDAIANRSVAHQVRTGKYTARDFNFEQQRFDLLMSISGGDRRAFEQYD